MSLVFFDIDGTLLLSGGAGVRAMNLAFETAFGVADAFAGVSLAGHTDTYLLSSALARAGLPDDSATHARFREAYVPLLAREIHKPGSGRRGVMPGVELLLASMRDEGTHHLALLTGNYEPAARIKLGHFGLMDFFGWGVFGEESPDRIELGRIAIRRSAERRVPDASRARVFVIGDTPHDIACGRAAGAQTVAVATGSYSEAELHEAGADIVLADLSETRAVLALLA